MRLVLCFWQLTSHKTYGNGIKRFEGGGMEGERQTVISHFFPQFEDGGWAITAKITSLWAGERDEETLFGGLDAKSKLLMKKLYEVVLSEEGEVTAANPSDENDAGAKRRDVDEAGRGKIRELDVRFWGEAATAALIASKLDSARASGLYVPIRLQVEV